MSDKNVHVTPRDGRWAVEREDSQRASSLHDTQAAAEAAGRVTARRDRVEFFLHGRNGQIRERDSYGDHPYPPRGYGGDAFLDAPPRDAMVERGARVTVRMLLSRLEHGLLLAVLALNRQYVPHRVLKWQRRLVVQDAQPGWRAAARSAPSSLIPAAVCRSVPETRCDISFHRPAW